MKSKIWIGVLAVLVFLAILVMRLPARWLSGSLPQSVSCAEISGTLWNGSCGALAWQEKPLGDLRWQLHPDAIFHGRLALQLALAGVAGTFDAELELQSGNRITARNLKARFELNRELLPFLPAQLRGQIATDLAQLKLKNGVITAIEGRIEAHDLEQRGAEPLPAGDYLLTFPPAQDIQADPVGELRSLRGPLTVEGKLKLTREPGFELTGLVAAGPDTPPEFAKELAMLGAPDARGRRPFSVAGTF